MDAFAALLTRTTAPALTEPAPDAEVLARALQAAMAAPDHGRLRPWRFLLIAGDDRLRFGEVLAEGLARRQPETGERELQRERERVLRAPLIIVAIARVVPDIAKVPEIEQVAACAAAVQNLLLALHAEGFGSMWKTGPGAYDPLVHERLGLAAGDRVLGFLYVGTPTGRAAQPRRGDWQAVTTTWTPPAPA